MMRGATTIFFPLFFWNHEPKPSQAGLNAQVPGPNKPWLPLRPDDSSDVIPTPTGGPSPRLHRHVTTISAYAWTATRRAPPTPTNWLIQAFRSGVLPKIRVGAKKKSRKEMKTERERERDRGSKWEMEPFPTVS